MAAGLPLLGMMPEPASNKKAIKKLQNAVKFTRDGLDLHPAEYAALLSQLADEGKIPVDNYSRGGAVEALEEKFAQFLDKESAVFMPTGTLANHLAVRKQAKNGRRVIVQAESHLYNDSGDCAQTLSGLNLIALNPGKTGFTLEEVRQAIEQTNRGRVKNRVGVISVESPVRRRNNAMFDYKEMRRISDYAREQGIAMHLDGARLFNASGHSGITPASYARLFDTVYISMYKDFNAASGAILAGTKEFTKDLFHTRRMFGGGMPQVWPFAVVALYYADGFAGKYKRAIQQAERLFALLEQHEAFKIERIPQGTNVFLLHLLQGDPVTFRSLLQKRNIEIPLPSADFTGFTMKINNSLLRRKPEEIAGVFMTAAEKNMEGSR